jgi:hypothetical protein
MTVVYFLIVILPSEFREILPLSMTVFYFFFDACVPTGIFPDTLGFERWLRLTRRGCARHPLFGFTRKRGLKIYYIIYLFSNVLVLAFKFLFPPQVKRGWRAQPRRVSLGRHAIVVTFPS